MSGSQERGPRSFIKVLALVCAFGLVGCQTFPTSGPVTAFKRSEPDSETVVLKGSGPVKDAQPEQIVRDFIRASGAGWSDDFQVARSYLTATAQRDWSADTQILIYPDDKPPEVKQDGQRVKVSAAVSGHVNGAGLYEPQARKSRDELEFRLSQDRDGQWRINSLPAGALVSRNAFDAAFTQAALYFLSPDKKTLVADQRWYPRRRLASHLMQGLIQGPAEGIQAAVVNAVPEGARLPLQSVEVNAGRAKVRVEAEEIRSLESQSLFKWQLTSTLMQVPSVTEVDIELNSKPLADVALPAEPQWALGRNVGLSDRGIEIRSGGSFSVAVPASTVGNYSADYPTIGPLEHSPIAYVANRSALVAVTRDGVPSVIYRGQELGAPSVDRAGWVWSVDAGELIAASVNNEVANLPQPWDSGGPLQQVWVSPDGAHALLKRGGEHRSVWIAEVKRSPSGTPLGLTNPRQVDDLNDSVDCSWAGNGVAVGLKDDGYHSKVVFKDLVSGSSTMAIPGRANRVSAGSSPQNVILEQADGGYLTRVGASWRADSVEQKSLTFPR